MRTEGDFIHLDNDLEQALSIEEKHTNRFLFLAIVIIVNVVGWSLLLWGGIKYFTN